MKAATTHIIKRLEYAITLDEESEAHTYQSKMSQLQEHKIQNILTKVMDAHHSPQYHDQYDRITLDLGTLSASNFENELAYKIEAHFSAFFKSNTTVYNALITGNRSPVTHVQLEQLLFFLNYGYLPWRSTTGLTPEDLLLKVLQDDKDALVQHFKTSEPQAAIRQRLSSQFSDMALEALVDAVQKNEGTFINTTRKQLLSYQAQAPMLAASTLLFKQVVWELILSYILTTNKDRSNRPHFLKYLISKIAARYNLTYKDLLGAIASGITPKQNTLTTSSYFEHHILNLYDEVRVDPTNSQNGLNADTIPFLETLDFFLKHHALPEQSSLTREPDFYTQIATALVHDKTAFFTLFLSHLKAQPERLIALTKRFPAPLLYDIITQAPFAVFKTITAFYTALKASAITLNLTSSTLTSLNAQFGTLALHAYRQHSEHATHGIDAFLHQILKTITIDAPFILTVVHSTKTDTYKTQQGLLKHLDTLKALQPYVPKLEQYSTHLTAHAKALHSYYQGVKALTQAEFERLLRPCRYYNSTTFKLTLALVERYSQHKLAALETLSEWLVLRLIVVEAKGKDTHTLLNETEHIATLLVVDPKLKAVILHAKKRLQSKDSYAFKALPKAKNNSSKSNYKQLLNTLLNAFFKRDIEDLSTCIAQNIAAFSKTFKVSETTIISTFKNMQTEWKVPEGLFTFLKLIPNTNSTTAPHANSNVYAIELSIYYMNHGKLPWWATSKSIATFQYSIRTALDVFPELLIAHFKTAQYQNHFVAQLDTPTFNSMLSHIQSVAALPTIATHDLFVSLLKGDLSGLAQIPPAFYTALKLDLLKTVLKTPSVDSVQLTQRFLQQVTKAFNCAKHHVEQLLLERLKAYHADSQHHKALIIWLSNRVTSPLTTLQNSMTQLQTTRSWSTAINTVNSKILIEDLNTLSTTQPELLYFYLKQISFRKQLIEHLNFSAQKRALTLVFPIADHHMLLRFFELFKALRTALNAKAYQHIWIRFIDKLFLNSAIQAQHHRTVHTWTAIFYESLHKVPAFPSKRGFFKTLLDTTQQLLPSIATHLHPLLDLDTTALKAEQLMPEIREEEDTIGDAIFIENAGLIIIAPYIPMLFDRMQLLNNGTFVSDSCLYKALYALQYAATGNVSAQEQDLILNKIICGMPIYAPVPERFELSVSEKTVIDGMLKAIISHWSTIGNTSIEGLRGSFLCRPGRITIEDQKYVLNVEARSFDMLLDTIPWSIAQLKLSWMTQLIEVIWRT